MIAMIPQRSIAIMTRERAHIKGPEVRRLAEGIIDAHVPEIAATKPMDARLEANPVPAGAPSLLIHRDADDRSPPP